MQDRQRVVGHEKLHDIAGIGAHHDELAMRHVDHAHHAKGDGQPDGGEKIDRGQRQRIERQIGGCERARRAIRSPPAPWPPCGRQWAAHRYSVRKRRARSARHRPRPRSRWPRPGRRGRVRHRPDRARPRRLDRRPQHRRPHRQRYWRSAQRATSAREMRGRGQIGPDQQSIGLDRAIARPSRAARDQRFPRPQAGRPRPRSVWQQAGSAWRADRRPDRRRKLSIAAIRTASLGSNRMVSSRSSRSLRARSAGSVSVSMAARSAARCEASASRSIASSAVARAAGSGSFNWNCTRAAPIRPRMPELGLSCLKSVIGNGADFQAVGRDRKCGSCRDRSRRRTRTAPVSFATHISFACQRSSTLLRLGQPAGGQRVDGRADRLARAFDDLGGMFLQQVSGSGRHVLRLRRQGQQTKREDGCSIDREFHGLPPGSPGTACEPRTISSKSLVV